MCAYLLKERIKLEIIKYFVQIQLFFCIYTVFFNPLDAALY